MMKTYTNPVIPGFHPDPSICRVGEDFYLVNSSFEYFPAIPVFHSKDLVHWEQIGHCVTKSENLALMHGNVNATGIYAPTIRYHEGRFYVIVTNITTDDVSEGRFGNFIVSTDDPYGEWSEPVWLDCPGIDPSLLFDTDGKVYYCGTHGGPYICEINPWTGERLTERNYVWYGTGGTCPEGPHVYHIGDWYYLMISEGGTEYGHMVTIARSRNIYGPYDAYEKNPILTNRSMGKPIMATGHADLVEDQNGNWWAVCLGIRPIAYPNRHNLGRETFLVPVTWNKEGWPEMGINGLVEPEMTTDKLPETDWAYAKEAALHKNFREEFRCEKLDDRWNYLYNPVPGAVTVDTANGGLLLRGSEGTLSDKAGVTFLGCRQEYHDCHTRTLLDVSGMQTGAEAGLTIFMNRDFHYEAALVKKDAGNVVIIRRRLGSLWKVENEVAIDSNQIYLELNASKESYRFSYSLDGKEYQLLGSGEAIYLTTEVGGAFTGNYIAMYATGNGKSCANPVRFAFFELTVDENVK